MFTFSIFLTDLGTHDNKYLKTRQSSCVTARGVPPAPPHLQKFPKYLSKMLSIFCPKLCPFFLSIFCWGGYPRGRPPVGGYPQGRPPSWGYPWGRPLPVGGGTPGGAPPPSLGIPRGCPPQLGGTPGGTPPVGGVPRGRPPFGDTPGGAPPPPSWGDPRGPPSWGVPPGAPPQLGGPPVNRQTENITFPSYSVCGR